MPKLNTQDLLERIQPLLKARAGQCQVTVVNACPPDWKITIVAGGIKFFYRDGSDYIDGPRQINLGSGGSATFIANDANKCVHHIFAALVVLDGNTGQSQTLTHDYEEEPNMCTLHLTLTLGPKSIAVDKLGSASTLKAFALAESR